MRRFWHLCYGSRIPIRLTIWQKVSYHQERWDLQVHTAAYIRMGYANCQCHQVACFSPNFHPDQQYLRVHNPRQLLHLGKKKAFHLERRNIPKCPLFWSTPMALLLWMWSENELLESRNAQIPEQSVGQKQVNHNCVAYSSAPKR